MRVGLLYESDEWSDHKLAAELADALAEAMPGQMHDVEMIDMTTQGSVDHALTCDALVSRVFASAIFRDHGKAHAHMDELIEAAHLIPMINDPRAHAFEVDKLRATRALQKAGIAVPDIYACGTPSAIDTGSLPYPSIIKPNCGGRTTLTTIAHSAQEAAAFLANAPDLPFIVQEYIEPERGYITRVEIVGGKAALVAERSIAANGLSGYHLGSTYQVAPNPSAAIVHEAQDAAAVLGFTVGSFDIIETDRGAFFIDANSVSNVSEDCTELFSIDLMRLHAKAIAARLAADTGSATA